MISRTVNSYLLHFHCLIILLTFRHQYDIYINLLCRLTEDSILKIRLLFFWEGVALMDAIPMVAAIVATLLPIIFIGITIIVDDKEEKTLTIKSTVLFFVTAYVVVNVTLLLLTTAGHNMSIVNFNTPRKSCGVSVVWGWWVYDCDPIAGPDEGSLDCSSEPSLRPLLQDRHHDDHGGGVRFYSKRPSAPLE